MASFCCPAVFTGSSCTPFLYNSPNSQTQGLESALRALDAPLPGLDCERVLPALQLLSLPEAVSCCVRRFRA